jgi:hypothetical protein
VLSILPYETSVAASGSYEHLRTCIERNGRSGLDTYGPIPFQAYIAQHHLPAARTWQYVSVDSLDRLSPDLREAMTMIFRLGSRSGVNGTHLGLAKCLNGWNDYFLDDRELIKQAAPDAYLPSASARRLFAFHLLPKLTETSLVNLAVGSGLLQYALRLSEGEEQVVPATGQSSFTFDIAPRLGMPIPWQHVQGQVEIDALFVGRRDEKECLFLVEAKSGSPTGTLAKHKLCYPLAALRGEVPEYIRIIPVYLKTWTENDGQHFLITECSSGDNIPIVITEFVPTRVHHLVLHGFGR